MIVYADESPVWASKKVAGLSGVDAQRMAFAGADFHNFSRDAGAGNLEKGGVWLFGLFPLLDQNTARRLVEIADEENRALFFTREVDASRGVLVVPPSHPECAVFFPTATHAHVAVRKWDDEALMSFDGPADFPVLSKLAYRRNAEALTRAGVWIEDLDAVLVERTVVVEADAQLGTGVALRGKTQIGVGALIDCGALLTDVFVDSEVHIKPYSVLEDCRVGRAATVGPFAHVRPGTQLGEKVRIGNFVETKKLIMGEGSKASHLAYLGDATVGRDCNIGAGTITCNYDGYQKHQTELGDGVFIGSDSQLVAPVRLQDGAYVAAGSTITRDIGVDGLGIARAKQVNKEGRARLLRERAARNKAES